MTQTRLLPMARKMITTAMLTRAMVTTTMIRTLTTVIAIKRIKTAISAIKIILPKMTHPIRITLRTRKTDPTRAMIRTTMIQTRVMTPERTTTARMGIMILTVRTMATIPMTRTRMSAKETIPLTETMITTIQMVMEMMAIRMVMTMQLRTMPERQRYVFQL